MEIIEISWTDIKKGLYAYMYGAEEALSEALRKKIGQSLQRQMEIRIQHEIHGELARVRTGPDISHDGHCIDLDAADYSRIEQRILANDLSERDENVGGRGSPTGRYDRPILGNKALAYSSTV